MPGVPESFCISEKMVWSGFPAERCEDFVSYSSKGRKVRRRRKSVNVRNLIILIGGAVVTIVLFVLLVSGAVRLVSKGLGAISGLGDSEAGNSSTTSSDEPSSEESQETAYTWSTVQMAEADERQGELILVNSSHEYRSEPEDLLIFYGNKTNSYGLKEAEMYAKSSVVTAMNNMMDAFKAATGNSSVLLTSSYRDVSQQQELYDKDLESTGLSTSDSVSKPGCSEHHTGYALDLSYTSSAGNNYLDGTGDYAWLVENCYKYGFIVRYTEEKSSITGIISEPWHYRYVGTVHAEAITKGGYCLEEYIEMIKLHDSTNPYEFTSESGSKYLIYYTEGAGATTDVPVISGKSYTISGTNEGGFVTVVSLDGQSSAVTSSSDDTSGSDSGESGSSADATSNESGSSESSEGSDAVSG